MKSALTTVLPVIIILCVAALGEVPLMSSAELQEAASHVVVGEILAVYSTTDTSGNYKNTRSVAEIAVVNVEKGADITIGDTVYAHFWNKSWIGKGTPEPGSSGHLGVAKGEFVRAHLNRKNGTYKVILPNGLTKLKPDQIKTVQQYATSQLDGTWNFVYYEEKGVVEAPGTKQFVITDNQLQFQTGGETKVETTIAVNNGTLDQEFKDGQVYRSVYKRIGDLLILCGNRDKDRPTEFAAGTNRGGEFFIVLKRQ